MVLQKTIQVSALALMAFGGVACGGGGSSSSGTVTPPPAPVADTNGPTLSFSPASLAVASGGTGTATLTANDNVGVTSGPTVTCTNGGTFSGSTFTAPTVTVDTTVICTATAGDAAGNSGTANLTVNVTAPNASFTPSSLTVASGGTGTVTVAAGSVVTCTNGGVFAGNLFTAPIVTEDTVIVCSATDAAGNALGDDLTVNVSAPPPPAVTISGRVTFEHVPFSAPDTSQNGLNFNAITRDPAPGVTVQALNSAGTVLQSTQTDATGNYSFEVAPNTDVRIRALAEMVQTGNAEWDVRVIDNTSNDSLYAIQGALRTSGTVDSVRVLNAASGWGGTSYTSPRAAAPFAILAPIYESIQRVVAVDSDVEFPPAIFNWSVNNRPSTSDPNVSQEVNIDAGDIETSSYIGNGRILILGAANNDTDEYDEHVVIHEWGHYFEDQLSRSDSIGGEHNARQRLDPRLALGEGFGNALSGMMTDDPFYRDSFGSQQAADFFINVEANNYNPEGWFNEGSVQSILYDIYDTVDDGPDTISAGLAPIYEVLTSASYTGSSFFITIFNFLEEYRANNPGDVAAVNALASAQSISGTDTTATGETNTGNISGALPLYRNVAVNGAATNFCLTTAAGTPNKLGNRAYLVFNVTSPGNHTLEMSRTSGASSTDPDFAVFRDGTFLGQAISGDTNVEEVTANLTTAGQHTIDATNFEDNDACFNFTISR